MSSMALQVSKVSAAAPPSCMCTVGAELIFLGSCAGDSLLLRALPEQQAKSEVQLLSFRAPASQQLTWRYTLTAAKLWIQVVACHSESLCQRESKEMDTQVLALKTAEEALKDAMYANGHDRKRQRTEPSVPGLDMTDDEDEACAGHLCQCKRRRLL